MTDLRIAGVDFAVARFLTDLSKPARVSIEFLREQIEWAEEDLADAQRAVDVARKERDDAEADLARRVKDRYDAAQKLLKLQDELARRTQSVA